MKKLILFLISIMIFTFSAGCAPILDTNSYNINVYCMDNRHLSVNKVVSIENHSGFDSNFSDYTLLIRSYAQFNAFLESDELKNPSDAFNKQIKAYNSEYFVNNYLIFIADWQPSGSINLTVDRITFQNDTVNVYVKSQTPQIGTDDMKLWIFLIEIDADNNLQTISYQVTKG